MELSGQSPRWQGQRSPFPWEQEALDYVRALMPDAAPYWAYQNFSFTAFTGHVRQVDLFIATPGGLFLVEIKSHPGVATNHGSTWIFKDGTATRTVENPLHLTDQKAKELKSLLEKAASKHGIRERIPFIAPAVFLSAQTLVCKFDEFQVQRVYGRDDKIKQTNLEGIWQDLLAQPPTSERNRVTPTFARQLPQLLRAIGAARQHRIGKIGPYELEPKSFDTGPTWEDYLATNPSLPNDQPRRVRIYLTERTATPEEKASVRRAARREYLALQDISHDGIVRAEQFSEELQAGPAVVLRHGRNWQRLDQFMAASPDLPLETRLDMIRQLAEALDHAHRRHLYHRALAPRSVYVELDGRYPRLRIADWQVAARPHTGTHLGEGTSSANDNTTLLKHVERSVGPYLSPEVQTPDAPPGLLDVFGLGAVSYLILTGQPPADSRGQLAQRLAAEQALVPSTVADSISPAMDALIRDATQVSNADRTESVRSFLRTLDAIEEELTAPNAEPDKDPLTANPGDEINGWKVRRILGKGSTSKALLVTKDANNQRVFKVALTESAASRLELEARQLGQLNDSHVARLLDAPFQAGPPNAQRTLIGVEYIEGDTLHEEIRQHGPLTLHELERLGEDLFQAVTFLDKRGVYHRDIKPANLALRELERKGRELVLFDFSLAGTPDTDLTAGTNDYLDPFLGPPNRMRYDQAAELYAVAVTLHEMASGELPSWGDDQADARFLATDEEVQLAEDLFDPVARDGLVEFFKNALHRDAARRFANLHDMTRAWTDVFSELESIPPLTTAATQDEDDADSTAGTRAEREEAAWAKREDAARKAAATTPLAAAGLSPHALSVAQQRLGLNTAGDLARVQARHITRLRGIGARPRYELVRRSREWRQRFNLTESGLPRPDVQLQRGRKDHAAERLVVSPLPQPASQTPADLKRLSVDEVIRYLIPDESELGQVAGLRPSAAGPMVSPWASHQDTVRVTGLPAAEVAASLERLRNRWQKSVPALLPVRDDLVDILAEHGRILGWRQLAAGLLARRGSELGDSAERLRLAAICVRAAVETEERRDGARMVVRRLPSRGDGTFDARILIALTETALDGGRPTPNPEELFIYAEWLGMEADALSARDPLPGVTEIRQVLRGVDTAEHATRLSDTDLVLLAAAASAKTAATPRLELYPRDLTASRALKISQAGSIAEGVFADELVRRMLARFPDLYEANRPSTDDIPDLLRDLGYDVTRGSDARLHLHSSTQLSGSRSPLRPQPVSVSAREEELEHATAMLAQSRKRGGFIALKTSLRDASAVCDTVAALDGVTPVDVTATFVTFLHEVVEADKRPLRWETVLAADSPDASAAARNGLAQLLRKTWDRFAEHIRSVGASGIVLLHDATPVARYTGGIELLAKLTVAARSATDSPHGLWLLCPMEDPHGLPLLDRTTVSVILGDAEQLYVPGDFARTAMMAGRN
jgi:serine/threonine protein kinase